MRCRIFTLGTLLAIVLTACGEPEPVSTGTKAPGLNRSATQPATTTTSSGDATKGQTALTASCNTCHGKSAHALNKSDVGSMDAAGAKSYHSSVASVFTTSGSDIKAYLATQ